MRKHLPSTMFSIAALLTGCTSSHEIGSAPTTAGSTTTASTTAAPSTTPPSTTTAACTEQGDLLAKQSPDQNVYGAIAGSEIRTGAHPCFERVVIEFAGTGTFPAWQVAYVSDPIPLGQSGMDASLRGDATLLVRLTSMMASPPAETWEGPTQIFPTTVQHVRELRLAENFEGIAIWGIGLDQQYPFLVFVLHSPERLVIDIYTA